MREAIGTPSTPTKVQARAWADGRLEQRCARCGLREAAGNYCSSCQAPSTRADWYESTATTTVAGEQRQTARRARR